MTLHRHLGGLVDEYQPLPVHCQHPTERPTPAPRRHPQDGPTNHHSDGSVTRTRWSVAQEKMVPETATVAPRSAEPQSNFSDTAVRSSQGLA